MVDFLITHISNQYLMLTLVSMIPLTEIKGSILLGLSLGLSPLYVYWVCFLGSSIPIPFVILLSKPILKLIKKGKTNKFALCLERGILSKFSHMGMDKHIFFKLFSFVAIPMPLTGAYTGSIGIALMNLPVKSVFAVILGNAVAGLIVLGVGLLFGEHSEKVLYCFLILIPIFILFRGAKKVCKIRKKI